MADRTASALTGLALLALVCAGCTPDPASSATSAPVTLSIGTDDQPDVPATDQISALADEVERSGRVVLDPVWHAAGDARDWDQAVARMVQDGELELAVVPSRAWASLGTKTLEPLTTPFLIQSDEALDAVLADDELMRTMLAGLDEVGVVGIAAFPEGLRRPFGYHGSLVAPSDYTGGLVRTATAEVNGALYRAFGASVTDDHPDFEKHLGTDSSYLLGPYGTATGNVVLYPKVNVLVANADAWAGLADEQRDAIVTAAQHTGDWVRKNQQHDSTAAQEWCAKGGTIVAATPEQLAAFEAAAQPVVDAITADPARARVVDRIRAVIDDVDAPEPTVECEKAVAAPEESGSTQSIAGTYRYELPEELIAASGHNTRWCPEVCGVYNWTFSPDGTWRFRWEELDGGPETGSAHGTWSYDGSLLVLEDPTYQTMTLTVEVDPEGNLTLEPFDGLEEIDVVALTTTPWLKVE